MSYERKINWNSKPLSGSSRANQEEDDDHTRRVRSTKGAAMTPTEARELASEAQARGMSSIDSALRSLADQVEALQKENADRRAWQEQAVLLCAQRGCARRDREAT